ncbi:MAG: lysophospholipid acyltransferase family protein [Proteobacteria bacterium]|nr:lysophospholipid acyltransferase family protein [Pseudomonadota bacterium]MDA1058252.1 lysophospholipid acyltransferase family protein [Pseudomonadota bacterium]
MLKRLTRKPRVQALLAWLAAQYILLVRHTMRWNTEGTDTATTHWAAGQPFILAFWHGRLLVMTVYWRRKVPMNMLISYSADGELIARAIGRIGIAAIRGSPKRGGAAAVRGMVKVARAGQCIGFTPDGPRGPRMHAAQGVIDVARLSGLPILPVSLSTRRGRILSTWDRFLVPLPFSKGAIHWGTPMTVARDADADTCEAARAALEAELIRLTDAADHACGQAQVRPAEMPSGGTVKAPAQ